MEEVKRGDIWVVDLGINEGREENNTRPCLVIQNDIGNRYSPTTIILPISHQKWKLPTHIKLDMENVQGIVKSEQIRVVDKNRLLKKIGAIPSKDISFINDSLEIALGLKESVSIEEVIVR